MSAHGVAAEQSAHFCSYFLFSTRNFQKLLYTSCTSQHPPSSTQSGCLYLLNVVIQAHFDQTERQRSTLSTPGPLLGGLPLVPCMVLESHRLTEPGGSHPGSHTFLFSKECFPGNARLTLLLLPLDGAYDLPLPLPASPGSIYRCVRPLTST